MLLRARQKWLTPGRKGKCRCTTARGTLHVRIIKLTPLGGIATISTFDSTGLPEDDPGFHDSRMCCRRASCASAITAGWPTAAGASGRPCAGESYLLPTGTRRSNYLGVIPSSRVSSGADQAVGNPIRGRSCRRRIRSCGCSTSRWPRLHRHRVAAPEGRRCVRPSCETACQSAPGR